MARQREEEIKKRKYSYFKENQKKKVEEDKTKLFFDENMIKKSFEKKQIIETDKIR